MMKKIIAQPALATAALIALLTTVPGSNASATSSSQGDYNLRGHPNSVTVIDQETTSSNFVGRVLQSVLNTSEGHEDLDIHYPLFLTGNERAKEDYNYDDVLWSFTITKESSNILRQPPSRRLAEAAHGEDAAHGEEGDHGDAHDMVVHVTYENIYAILVFLICATALGIITSKLGMVSSY